MLFLSTILFISNLFIPKASIAFAPILSCPNKSGSSSTSTSREKPCQQSQSQKNQYYRRREQIGLHAFEATKSDQDPIFLQLWYPNEELDDTSRRNLEEKSLELATELVHHLLSGERSVIDAGRKEYAENLGRETGDQNDVEPNQVAYELAKGRFVDFCGDRKGEELFESIFLLSAETETGKALLEGGGNHDIAQYRKVVEGAVFSLQSLLVLGMTYGVTLNPKGVSKLVAHMKEDAETDTMKNRQWTPAHSIQLKYRAISDADGVERIPALQLLASLNRKRTPLGAYNLLVRIGVWKKHENLYMLRSGFPLRFSDSEEDTANRVYTESIRKKNNDDPDELLGIRRDFRSKKIYTIDSASTKEIDDGLGVEVINDDSDDTNGKKRYRYWIHIADADRWARRESQLFELARRRSTSIYLPETSIPMMPPSVSQQLMSLTAKKDVCALSLGVELKNDGSIIDDSIIVTTSVVRVDYRLTYDEADEMLEDGVGYAEEWELGQLYDAAQRRRKFRMDNGSAEDFVPIQIPQYAISTFADRSAPDDVGINIDVRVSHNGGKNQSSTVADSLSGVSENTSLSKELPVSSASTLVTEMMILAGEAIGKWAVHETKKCIDDGSSNSLELPFRSQEKPDFRSREREKKIMMDLREHNIGNGFCHAWYSRRFLSPAQISPDANPHSGLGLSCYVQWTSPIRRFQDLQVHATVKRFIRRQKVINLLNNGKQVPPEIKPEDLGCELLSLSNDGRTDLNASHFDRDIDYTEKSNLFIPIRNVQRNSNKYWMLEYIRRIKEKDPQRTFEVLVLGCINPVRRQYAVYIYELGLEWRYNSPVGIQAGDKFIARCGNVIPQNGQLSLVRLPNGSS